MSTDDMGEKHKNTETGRQTTKRATLKQDSTRQKERRNYAPQTDKDTSTGTRKTHGNRKAHDRKSIKKTASVSCFDMFLNVFILQKCAYNNYSF
jgi:hypothetical protein